MKEFYIADDGIQLHAKLDVPEEKEKCPLVIVFHGLTGNMEERHITAVSSAMNEIGFATLRVELYGKDMRPGRKVGHVNCYVDDLDEVRARAEHAARYLMGEIGEG